MIPEIVIYLIKVNLALLLFYLGYRLLLQRYTFYKTNRYYLLISLFYSALYPFLDFNQLFSDTRIKTITTLAPNWQESITVVINQSSLSPNALWQIPIFIFWTGVIILSARLFMQLFSLHRVHQQSEPGHAGGFNFRKVNKAVSPFSFWKSIYLNPECHDDAELLPILEHEKVHIDQLHTIDVMLAELCTIFYWFNPGVWLMKNAIKANLEYITDQEVIRSGIDQKDYQYALLRINTLESNNLPVNNFKILSLKQRISMINKKPTSSINLGGYLLLVPAILFFLSVVSVSQAALHPTTSRAMMKVLPDIPTVLEILEQQDTVPEKPVELRIKKVSPANSNDTGKVIRIQGQPIDHAINISTTNTPLYIVDGLEMVNIKALDPTAIESITVLKDASAVRLYGEKGSDGVIVVTTKKDNSIQTGAGNNVIRFNTKQASGAQGSGTLTVTGYSSDSATGTRSLSATTVTGEKLNGSGSATATTEVEVTGRLFKNAERVDLSELKNLLILLDGKQVTYEKLQDLPASNIKDISILKGKAAIDKYGEKAKEGAVIIRTN